MDKYKIRGYWFITNTNKSICIENSIYHNDCSLNTLRAVEAITTVELVITIHQKTKALIRGWITVYNDNNKLIQIINNELSPMQYTQKAAAEVAFIK